MKTQFALSLSFICMVFHIPSHAEWFEVTGVADIKNGDHQKAKKQAVNDAITQALLFSGATVSSVQTVTDGVLTQDQLKIRANGEIQGANVIAESRVGDAWQVTLHIDITPQQSQCSTSAYNKQIAITQSQLKNKHQATLGQIFDINKIVSERLYHTLSDQNQSVEPVPYFAQKIDVNRFFSQRFDYNEQLIETVTANTNSQYVLLSQISDISSVNKLNNDLAFWQSDKYLRSFKIEFILFDALSHEKVWQQRYGTQGVWPFKKTKLVDVYSEQFWQTDYAAEIQTVLNQVSVDLNSAIACLPTHGKILHIDDEQVVINLGRMHGLEEGQVLSIAHSSPLTDAGGNVFMRQVKTLNKLQVIQVNAQTAIAVNQEQRPLNNVQINDLVEIHIEKDDLFAL
ncbi:flagellar assembly protein T N-terminal domain-containing protein [Pseudoalteromonas sp. McH1-7]|uniref:flagellar assembly protein T N-terminal domain-containing protein n=1 Tax=Pseudoalteromonas TaxID=53246 RepID=UPI0015920623|nr:MULTISPECIES: flagellar assembly protein T N-terminal domain-containing protein [Pseudoalteromonas]MDW7550084.1 flagellar assembly protein T N-terminal domain-containing protein [Pseudoalteromonas peptidolytica]NUZ09629.1 flagellar assembly protein T N-terminal domain-containing protein [Pseudoalteromonas sp. McH1-7]USD29581.1 flagellar assembly protein T N-terminal domain-containing protein [Pseudoalteromonas sp. SCSIO 43201]